MGTKIFKTLDEQIQILIGKGLVIDDIIYAKDIVLRENYFFLMGYRHLFLDPENPKHFKKGTTFKELYSLFYFDRQLRNIMFKNILIIENNCKSIFSYTLSQKYGYKENDYLRPSNYNQAPEKQRQVNDLLKKMKRQIRVNGGQHEATKHYINNYGYIPLWIVVKVLSFGITSELYTIMKFVPFAPIHKPQCFYQYFQIIVTCVLMKIFYLNIALKNLFLIINIMNDLIFLL